MRCPECNEGWIDDEHHMCNVCVPATPRDCVKALGKTISEMGHPRNVEVTNLAFDKEQRSVSFTAKLPTRLETKAKDVNGKIMRYTPKEK